VFVHGIRADPKFFLAVGEMEGLNAVLMRRQSCVEAYAEAYAEDAQAPASFFGSEKEGSLSKA